MRATADRTVTVRLDADVKPYLAAMAQAEAATKRLREGMGRTFDPWEREVDKQSRNAPKDAENIAGSFGRSFSKRLEAAFKSLPKAKITADSTQADIEIAQIREKLLGLADKRIGIDMDATTALMEVDQLQRDLERLKLSGATIDVQADAGAALAELQAVEATVSALDGKKVEIKAEVDAGAALASMGKLVAATQAASFAVPAVAGLVAAAGSLQGAFISAGAGVIAFKAAAAPALKRVQEAVDKADFSKLSPDEFELAQKWQEFSDIYLDWQRSVNPEVTQALGGGLDLMGKTLPKISPLVAGTATAFVGLEKNAERALNGEFWNTFLRNLGVSAPQAVTGFGNSLLNVSTGVAGVIDAFLPFTPNVVNPIEKASKEFAEWGQSLKDSKEFHEFLLFVKENAPEAWELIKNLATALVHVGEAVGPLGVGSMSGLSLLAKIVAGMDPEHIRLIALAIIAIKTAQAGLSVARFFTEIPGKLGTVRDGFDKAKTAASNFGETVGGLKDKVSGASALIGGVALTGGLLLLEDRLNKNAIAAGRFADKIQALAGSNVDSQIKAMTDEINRLKDAAGPSLDLGVVNLAPFAWDSELDKIDALEEKIAQLRHQKELDAIASKTAQQGISGLGTAAATTSGQINSLNTTLGTFNSTAGNSDQAAIAFEGSVDRLAESLRENGRTLDIHSEKGRTNRLAILDAAKAAADHAAKVYEETGSIDKANGVLDKHAAELRTVLRDAGLSEGAIDKLIKKYLTIPKSVKTNVEADVKAAQQVVDHFVQLNSGRRIPISVYAKQERAAAQGAIMRYAAGGIERYAAGGMRPQPPQVVSRPTVLFGEGSSGNGATEAFIPYESRYRQRATELLGQVADDFGLMVFDKRAARTAESMTVAIDATNMQISAGLTSAMGVLTGTLGDTGSLTSAVAEVGTVGQAMTKGWLDGAQQIGDATIGMTTEMSGVVVSVAGTVSGSVDSLTGSVYELTQTIASFDPKAGAVAATAKKSTGTFKGKSGAVSASATKSMGTFGKAKAGAVGATAKKSMGTLGGVSASAKKSKGALGGLVAGSQAAISGFSSAGLNTSAPVNTSRVSAPQRVTSHPAMPMPSSAPGSGSHGGTNSSQSGGVHVPITMNGVTVREEADIPKIGKEVGFNQLARPF